MKIKVWGESGIVGGDREDELEVATDATDEDCEEAAREWFFNNYSYGWSRE